MTSNTALNRYFNDKLANSGSVSDALKIQNENVLDVPNECYIELVQMGYATVDNKKEIGYVVNTNYELLFPVGFLKLNFLNQIM
ncbi:hypothetical protein HNW13_017820 [Shewanella sp. BF02_Schw]|uniref:hypothetical protein n=1 Tax=Shewanella sp. BF02_Schw TaxID=394908 RepID=UPI001785A621|nr:hypothetical protein [Shewanella sp. BF02_Schw]MBO1897598.1 hypothetical protein [Shewanella sp. BF02_Schw]